MHRRGWARVVSVACFREAYGALGIMPGPQRAPAASGEVLLHRDVTDAILGAFFDVYGGLGYGFLEAVYANALALELRLRGRRVEREVSLPVFWKETEIGHYRADLIVDRSVLVELKAGRHPDPSAEAQVLNYLRAGGLRVALLLHFGPRPTFMRKVL